MSQTNSRRRLIHEVAILAACGVPACTAADIDTTSASDGSEEAIGQVQQPITGNIHPGAIQIDGPSDGADLYAAQGTPLNTAALLDWVADSGANSGSDCLGDDAIASCIEPGVTGAVGGTGHWNGVRIVDGIGSDDLDIFLTGGKENDYTTWNVGSGTVGSSKFDITQAYLANNQDTLFFGMERRGNNGTTAFDFEFNQLEPASSASCPPDPSVPCRSLGDVLFSFEMQGAGNSGSSTPFIFTWDGDAFQPSSAATIVSSINGVQTTAAAPWGYVDRHGDWKLGNLARFSFAEALAPLSLLPGVNSCGGTAYVQVRTRSSATVNSDLKDATKIFEFVFNSVAARATLTPSCDQGFSYSASGVDSDGNAIINPVCSWLFSDGSTSSTCSGFVNAAVGTHSGTVSVSDPNNPSCTDDSTAASVAVYAPIAVSASLGASCTSSFSYDATVTGGSDPAAATYAWGFSGGGATTPSASSSKSGTVAVGTAGVSYTGSVTVTDPRTDVVCTASDSDSATPYAPLAVTLALSGAGATCPAIASDAVSYGALPGGGDGSYTYSWTGATCTGAICSIDPADGTFCHDQSLSVTVGDGSGLCAAATSETETYSKTTTVTASDN
jgi:hypothetical protein